MGDNRAVQIIDPAGVASRLPAAEGSHRPRVVAAGNFATPMELLRTVDEALDRYTLHVLNAQAGIPQRPGVVHETTFVGPGMRDSATLSYVPSRLSLVPVLLRTVLVPDVVL